MKKLLNSLLTVVFCVSCASAQQTAPAPDPAAAAPTTPAVMTPGAAAAPDAALNIPDVAPETPPHKVLTATEARRIAQEEVLRQQELIYDANRAVAQAQKAELAQDYIKANVYYATAAESYGTGANAALSRQHAADGLTRVNLILYGRALDQGDEKRAKSLIEEALKYDPQNPKLIALDAKIVKALSDPNDKSVLGNVALTPAFVKNVKLVQQLFSEAEQFRRTGQWDEATDRLKHILAIDPYNIAATKFLERINDQKIKYLERARIEGRDEALLQVEEQWYEPIRNPDMAAVAQPAQPTLEKETNFPIEQKLKNISMTMDFNNYTIEQVVTYLKEQSKQLDPSPDHRGVPFVIQPGVDATAKRITLNLDVPLPMEAALRYICAIASVKYKVEDSYVSIVPFNNGPVDLGKHTFFVPPTFFATSAAAPAAGASGLGTVGGADAGGGGAVTRPVFLLDTTGGGADTNGAGQTVQQILESRGITFPPGASAVYTPTTEQLDVINTPDQIDLLEELVGAGTAPVYMVRVSTKFVEINQQDLNDFTVNTVVNTFHSGLANSLANGLGLFNGIGPAIQGSGNFVQAPQFVTALPGAVALPNNGLDTLLGATTPSENSFQIRGFLGGNELYFLINALAQKTSFDLLADPFTLVKNSEGATLEATRLFPYPTAFAPPQSVQQANANGAGGNNNNGGLQLPQLPALIPITPTDFKTRQVGIRLVTRPQITPDNKNIELTVTPEATDFQGFVNYGSPIFIVDQNNVQALMSANQLNQPVFSVRTINTRVLIHDGSTLVLGGLIREDTQNIDDRVPILGDIPMIGRLFQSKAVRKTKRNLIVFVTTTIYRNNGELLNPPEEVNAADVLTGRATVAQHP